jgi:hypothetical protein
VSQVEQAAVEEFGARVDFQSGCAGAVGLAVAGVGDVDDADAHFLL